MKLSIISMGNNILFIDVIQYGMFDLESNQYIEIDIGIQMIIQEVIKIEKINLMIEIIEYRIEKMILIYVIEYGYFSEQIGMFIDIKLG